MRTLTAVLIASIASCRQPPRPSDERFLAERERVAAHLGALFASNESLIAPSPEGEGAPTYEAFVGNMPDPGTFAAAGQVTLPVPTARLARCGAATKAALGAFAAITGEAMGEGRMGGRGLDRKQRYEEANRQLRTIGAAYCLWRDATRICRDEAGAAGRPMPAEFEPRFLECDRR